MVYRPPKKKTDGPGFDASRVSVDPLSGPLSRAADGEEILQGDDRHLVAVDESYAGGDFEDRLWVFWRKQRKNIVGLLAVIAAGLLIWQGWVAYAAHAAATLQADYQAANGATELLAFAQAHPEAPLGKFAQLEGADDLYKDSKFKEAADAYAQAATVWGDDEKGQRARLGQAMALIQAGDNKTGSELLEALSNDASVLENYRAEAAYDLVILAIQAGDNAGAAKWVERVKEFKTNNAWLNQIGTLGEVAPLISEFKAVNGYVPPAPAAAPAMTPTVETPAETSAPALISAPPASAPAPAPASPSPAPANGTDILNVPDFPALK
jgi:hypothetical protein